MTSQSHFHCNPVIAALLAELHSSCFEIEWNETTFLELLQIPGTIAQILEKDGRPCAFSLYRIAVDEAEILTLGVLPELRGQSIGHALLQEGEHYLQENGVLKLFLEVSKTNLAAIQLYGKSGYAQIGIRKNYYLVKGERIDALIMQKGLP